MAKSEIELTRVLLEDLSGHRLPDRWGQRGVCRTTEAEYVAQIWKALQESNTWGELGITCPMGNGRTTFSLTSMTMRRKYLQTTSRLSADAPRHEDGDYPPWLAQEQLGLVSSELIAKYSGNVTSSVLNGEFLDLPADKADEYQRLCGRWVTP